MGKQLQTKTTPYDKGWKRLDLFGRKAYSSATLQFHIANYSALLAKYTHNTFSQMSSFIEHIPADKKEQYKANIAEGFLIAGMALQASLDSADTAARSIATSIVMPRASWLHLSGFPREVQMTVVTF
ncbi:hypothetical protein UY3_17637 [Chelonia mydas]|uniref:Uncharacterized protein n=1 Tax=Chelonia mydas TaxID=8469 RepID=M7AJR2_CHEMY|nr:hypothetical protein UY3_17637 [Chelonia mydas]